MCCVYAAVVAVRGALAAAAPALTYKPVVLCCTASPAFTDLLPVLTAARKDTVVRNSFFLLLAQLLRNLC